MTTETNTEESTLIEVERPTVDARAIEIAATP